MPIDPIRLLITGFGPFPGILENASGPVALELAAAVSRTLPLIQATALVLPTDWDLAPRLLAAALHDTKPQICVHFGVAGNVGGMVVEAAARNAAGGRRDVRGRLPRSDRLIAGAPAVLTAGTGMFRLAARLAALGHPLEPAFDTGDYVCNAVYYRSLWAARQLKPRPLAVFIHIPVVVGPYGQAGDTTHTTHTLQLSTILNTGIALIAEAAELAPTHANGDHACHAAG